MRRRDQHHLPPTPHQVSWRLEADHPELPVLLSSGYTDEKSQWPVILQKGYRFLEKPYSLDTLLRAIKQTISS
jgi:DNA-binding NtrC family response regulator